MNYTIHQLKIFLKVVQSRGITKASERLFMTQPAMSNQLKKFQDQFDIPLTQVVGRQLYVTDFGREIAVIAERVIQEVENINYKTYLICFNRQVCYPVFFKRISGTTHRH